MEEEKKGECWSLVKPQPHSKVTQEKSRGRWSVALSLLSLSWKPPRASSLARKANCLPEHQPSLPGSQDTSGTSGGSCHEGESRAAPSRPLHKAGAQPLCRPRAEVTKRSRRLRLTEPAPNGSLHEGSPASPRPLLLLSLPRAASQLPAGARGIHAGVAESPALLGHVFSPGDDSGRRSAARAHLGHRAGSCHTGASPAHQPGHPQRTKAALFQLIKRFSSFLKTSLVQGA